MITIVLPAALIALIAGFFTGWFIMKTKATRRLNAELLTRKTLEEKAAFVRAQLEQTLDEKSVLSTRLFQSEQQEKDLKEALTQLSHEKMIFSTDLEAAWNLHTALKAKYDALYLKNIEVTNEKNRLKQQLPPGQGR